MGIEEALTIYVDWLKSKRRTEKTILTNARVLEIFFNVSRIQYVDDLNVESANRYSNYLQAKIADRTAKEYLIIIRKFCKFLKWEGIVKLKVHRINVPTYREKPVNYLERDEVDLVLNYFAQNKTIEGFRDYVFLYCLFDTGCRISEVLQLSREDINWSNKQAQVIGKGGRVRTVFFTAKCLSALKEYLEIRKDNLSALFISHSNRNKGERMTRYWIQKTLRKAKKELKLNKKINPHVMRSSFATDFFQNGGDIVTIQKILGHAKLSSTQRYLGVADRLLRSKYDQFHS